MRNTVSIAAALLLVSASAAKAGQTGQSAGQAATGPTPDVQAVTQRASSVDIGARYSSVDGDSARFQHFRDLGNGLFLEGFRFGRDGRDWTFNASADHAGRLDQRYSADFRSQGRVKLSFQWDQIPLFNSNSTRTPYSVEAPGVLRLSDGLQQAIQSGGANLSSAAAAAVPFDVKSRRDTAAFSAVFSASRAVDLKLDLKSSHRDGTQPYGAIFGMSNAIEVPAPIDTRTTDVNARTEYASRRGSFTIGYLGSWFSNAVPTLTWDNPLRFDDVANLNGSLGQMALPPNNDTQAFATSASLNLPAHSHVTANLTAGRWTQNQRLLPWTVNQAVPAAPLPRDTAEGEARTTAMNYTLTSRPSKYVWLNARYRYYNFDNRTPEFESVGFVIADQGKTSTDVDMSHVFSAKTGRADVDASFTPLPFTALRVGYTREQVDRTERIFARTVENSARASLDAVSTGWLTVRAIVEHASRTGSGFDIEHATGGGNQPATRYFDVADRTRNRVTALAQISPSSVFGLSASVTSGKDDYRNTGMGLRNSDSRIVSVTADFTPAETVVAGVSYTDEKYTALQTTRVANRTTFTDPSRDVNDDSADRGKSLTASLDLVKLLHRTDVRLGYTMTRSNSTYVWSLAPNSPLAAPVQLPAIVNDRRLATLDVRYFVSRKAAVGFGYLREQYHVDDFALSPATVGQLAFPTTGLLLMGYEFRPYTADLVSLRLTYLW